MTVARLDTDRQADSDTQYNLRSSLLMLAIGMKMDKRITGEKEEKRMYRDKLHSFRMKPRPALQMGRTL